MKKRILALALAIAVTLSLAACGGKNESGEEPNNKSTTSQTPAENQSTPAPDTKESEGKTLFEVFEEKLDSSNYAYNKTVMAAEMVGAKTGAKYTFDFGTVELYEFEEESEELNTALENGGLTLEGFGTFPCEFNRNFAALIDVSENQDTILSIFNSL